MGKNERLELIQSIQKKRKSKVITYIVGDRANLAFQIGSDTPRLFYDHLDDLGDKIPRLDLFLYSIGGDTSVPWRIISLFREFAEEVNVLVPYRAYSAATLLCLGADNVFMGRKGELGPIDPTVNSDFNPVDPIIKNRKLAINVEDVTSYIELIKEKFGIKEEEEIGKTFLQLTNAVNPIALGYINRHYSFIRMVATKLLKSHKNPFEDDKIQEIIEELIERIYFHGHGIARKEAKDLGLNICNPDKDLEDLMWKLYLEYEEDLHLTKPLLVEDVLDDNHTDEHILRTEAGGYIESENFHHIFQTDVKLKAKRAVPQSVTVNVNFQLPQQADPAQLNQEQLGGLQRQIQQLVLEQVRQQSEIAGYESRVTRFNWNKKKWS